MRGISIKTNVRNAGFQWSDERWKYNFHDRNLLRPLHCQSTSVFFTGMIIYPILIQNFLNLIQTKTSFTAYMPFRSSGWEEPGPH
jgi:hypothetical protein